MATTKVQIDRNVGHPWTGAPGWDRLVLQDPVPDKLTEAALPFIRKEGWQVWIDGFDQNGTPTVVLFKSHREGEKL